jgi:hypothetical protein
VGDPQKHDFFCGVLGVAVQLTCPNRIRQEIEGRISSGAGDSEINGSGAEFGKKRLENSGCEATETENFRKAEAGD